MIPRQLVNDTSGLISLPEVFIRLNQMADDPTSSSVEMGQVISQDSALSARLLKIVNSAFFGFPGKIDTISRAITIIGIEELRELAILTTACDVFTGIPSNLINMERFWHSALTCGALARSLAERCNILHPERLFVMGVLHDIGRLLMFQQLPSQSRDILLISKGRDDLIVAAERDMLGFTHGEVGYELARHWQLPSPICSVIRWHHQPEQASTDRLECYLVYIANIYADALVWEADLNTVEEQLIPTAWQVTGLSNEQCIQAVSEVNQQVQELYTLLMGQKNQISTAK